MAALTAAEEGQLAALLQRASLQPAIPAAVLGPLQDAFAAAHTADVVLYCFKLPGLQVRDAAGQVWVFVKVGKRESQVRNGYEYTAIANTLSRFKEHKDAFKKSFGAPIDIFHLKKDLKHNGRVMAATVSTMTAVDIRQADAVQQDQYADFCCLIEHTDEKALKKYLSKAPIPAELMEPCSSFAWTEVRVMKAAEFTAVRTSFQQGRITMSKFQQLAPSKVAAGSVLTVTYRAEGDDEDSSVDIQM